MSRFWTRIINIIVVLLFIVGFRSLILTDPTVSNAFEGLMGTLPFAEPFSKLACNILGVQNGQPLISTGGFIKDIAKLMVMACIQPPVTALCMLLFLRIPSGIQGIDAREAYMDRFGYRFREMLINVISAPFSAVFAGWLMERLLVWSSAQFGTLGSFLTGLISIIVALGLSAIPMVILGTTISVALLWRFMVTMLGGMLTALVTTLSSITLYYAFLNGLPSHVVGSIIGLLAGLIIVDIVIQCFQRVLGIYSVRSR